MLGLNTKLAKLEEDGKKIKVGLVGAGKMGQGMVCQMFSMKGMLPSLVVDIFVDKAVESYTLAGVDRKDITIAKTLSDVNLAIEQGKYVVAEDLEFAAKSNLIDVVVDATGIPNIGATLATNSILNGKHIVMLNVEADVVVGPILNKMAKSSGVIYTGTAGDEPGAIKELFDFADGAGFKVLAMGKGKNNPLIIDSTPDTLREQALGEGLSPRILTSFVDGTNTMIEMTCIANATGFFPDIMGGHGPKAKLDELTQVFKLKEEGGILNQYGIVDYVHGIAPGVFIIITSEFEQIRDEMKYLSMGLGPNYVLYRPFHLTSLETPLTVAKAVIDNEPTIAPLDGKPASEVVTIAKRDLRAGEKLDGIGGFTVYGKMEIYDIAKEKNLLPIGLINKNAVMKVDAKKGQLITYDMVHLDETTMIYKLRKLQDHIIG